MVPIGQEHRNVKTAAQAIRISIVQDPSNFCSRQSPGLLQELGTVKERTSVWLSKKEIIRVYGERLIAIAGRARNADGFFLWLIRIHCCNSKSPLWKY